MVDKRSYTLRRVDAKANARRARPPQREHTATPPRAQVPFDPAGALLDRARARAPSVTDDELGDALDDALDDTLDDAEVSE